MKKLFALIFVILMTSNAFPQSPQKMSYQCVVRNTSGVLITNQSIGIRIIILQGTVTGTVVYQETYNPNPQTGANGLVTVEIGDGLAITGTFSAINWASGPYFLRTEIDPTGGTNYTIVGTSQLLSVPYALYAKTSETSSDAVKILGNQTIEGNKTFNGTTTVASPVNATDAVTKAYVDALKSQMEEILLLSGIKIKDVDGNVYKTVIIGTQVWMAENLKTTKYNDNTAIPLVVDNTEWYALQTPGYCWYNNDLTTFKDVYGALYNWYSIDAASNNGKNVCPSGWHVPGDMEWKILEMSLGMSQAQVDASGRRGTNEGGKLKETGTTHWTGPNTGATNESGFTALPGGYRWENGTFTNIGKGGYWWNSTVVNLPNSYYRNVNYDLADVLRSGNTKSKGFSVRCLKN